MRMTHETDLLKGENAGLLAILQEMLVAVHEAAQMGTPVHEVERMVWRQVLKLGHATLKQFFATLGTGDMGEHVVLPDGTEVDRLPKVHKRRYVSIFGTFELLRTVYGSREGQKIEFVPLDNRLQLPESVFSYVLQDWDQSFCVEQAFAAVSKTIERILDLKQPVDSLEHMNQEMAQEVTNFMLSRPQPEEEAEIMVASADQKGIVLRRQA